ncbi:hypothetical protein QR680_006753 [Steinernema hermaphroditum]|uniref:TIL domain-containing protein n=1 Tax=Steinernema hermaphroditum TaxID=289476 RepID=A0AA39HXN3_9BILA|nr:hypothetical protein QR680_006753 [Steinernema hermaphroditum]
MTAFLTLVSLTVFTFGLLTSATDYPKCGKNESFNTCTDCEFNWYARDDSGKCIPRKEYPAQKCPEGEVFDICGGCELQCRDLKNPFCVPNCEWSSCKCPKGFARGEDRKCVKVEDCPKKSK